MGKIKDAMIREEDHFEEKMANPNVAQAVRRGAARVPAGGGDAIMGMMAVLAALEKEAADKGMTLEELADAAAQEEVSGAMAQADQSDKELDRAKAAAASTLPAPESAPEVPVAEESAQEPTLDDSALPAIDAARAAELAEVPIPEVQFEMPPQQYMKKGQHHTLVFQGVCSNCAHCAMKLTDAVSIERGLGPVCSKRGYLEDPTDPDENQAIIDLAEYPQLVEFLMKNYKPQGVRGLMNGLVKICSLNRRSPVHPACCDAIESLGYKRLASTLRESLAVIEIKEHDDKTYNVWVKKSEFQWQWLRDLQQKIPGTYRSAQYKGILVPKSAKQMLWAIILEHYDGLCAKVPAEGGGKKTVKILPKVAKAS
jgi:hypothetical protein